VEFYPRQGKGFKQGAIWRYWPVTETAYIAMSTADSVGAYFIKNIKTNPSITCIEMRSQG
jgi:hypothetical protein